MQNIWRIPTKALYLRYISTAMEKDTILFKRKMYDRLLKWKRERNGESAILIQGARRIGKSTLAEEFARNEYESYILIDFAIAPAEVQELFNDISDLNYIFLRLQLIYRVQLIERKSVIIFDEIQKAPLARQATNIWLKTVDTTISRPALSLPSTKAVRISCCRARRHGSICFRWTMKSFDGR